jgi:hypothetical protein
MGTRVPGSNPDMGMAAFNKQVHPTHYVLFTFANLYVIGNPSEMIMLSFVPFLANLY